MTITRHHLDHQSRRRTYTMVRAESGLAPGAALLIILHGTLQSGESLRTGYIGGSFDAMVATGRVVVVYPDAVRREWNGARKAVMFWRGAKDIDDVGFLRALVDELVARCDIDPHRVFVMGFSLGGQMAIRLIHDAPGIAAGAAIISANLPAPDNLSCQGATPTPLPLMLVHGTADPLAPYLGGIMSGPKGVFPKGEHLSAEETAAYFAASNGITSDPTTAWLYGAPAETGSVRLTRYQRPGCPSVHLYSVVGGGHQIPGTPAVWPRLFGPSPSRMSTADTVNDFFGMLPAKSMPGPE
ncbi:alpha/beta hydrolase family esterase [Nocardia sp. NPDC051570]|uniref:alpha/beta hydrolase family esterase n=1 Tax=Nocardia sp. NPDC051570 TaxID=3364324 RepID=UPI0037B0BA23